MTMVGQSYDFDGGLGDLAAPARVKTFAVDGNVGSIGTDGGASDNRFTLRVTHSIDEDGVGIIEQAGDGYAAAGPQESVIAGEEFSQRASTGVDGEPGVRGSVIAATTVFIFGPLHDDAGIGPTDQRLGKTNRRDPAVQNSVGFPEATDFDYPMVLADRVGGLIDGPGPLGPSGRDDKSPGVADVTGAGESGSSPGTEQLAGSGEDNYFVGTDGRGLIEEEEVGIASLGSEVVFAGLCCGQAK